MSYLDNDGSRSSDFIAVEEAHQGGQQALWVGVRPVYDGAVKSNVPMVQIEYQQQYMGDSLQGPVWLTPQTWRDLDREVKWRLRSYEPLHVRVWRKLTGR